VFELVSVTTSVVISDRYAGHNMETWGVQKTKNLFGFGFTKTEPSKNLTSVQTVFRQKLNAIQKITLLALSVQIKNVSKHYQNRD